MFVKAQVVYNSYFSRYSFILELLDVIKPYTEEEMRNIASESKEN